jgi:hypothetical protein
MEKKLVKYNININNNYQIYKKLAKKYLMLEVFNHLFEIDSIQFIVEEFFNQETLKFMQIEVKTSKVKQNLDKNELLYICLTF